MFTLCADEELEAVVVGCKVAEQNALRFALGVFHVVDVKLGEVACDNPARAFRIGQDGRIALRLLEGREARAVALADRLAEVFAKRFLLDEGMGGGNKGVDKRRVVELCLLLEADELRGVRDTVDLGKEFGPEQLTFSFFVAAAFPSVGKEGGGRALLLFCIHSVSKFNKNFR